MTRDSYVPRREGRFKSERPMPSTRARSAAPDRRRDANPAQPVSAATNARAAAASNGQLSSRPSPSSRSTGTRVP